MDRLAARRARGGGTKVLGRGRGCAAAGLLAVGPGALWPSAARVRAQRGATAGLAHAEKPVSAADRLGLQEVFTKSMGPLPGRVQARLVRRSDASIWPALSRAFKRPRWAFGLATLLAAAAIVLFHQVAPASEAD